jgi:hypothetical protein
MGNKLSAVEWLKENLPSIFQDDSGHYQKLFEQAKAMEKEQIMDAYAQGTADEAREIIDATKDAEQYYNETYGK